jgi:outer membrane immunogenic protein
VAQSINAFAHGAMRAPAEAAAAFNGAWMGDETMNFRLFGTGVAALSLLAASFSAQAADIPRPVYKAVRSVVAYYNWTGFYAGINGGYAWGTSNWDVPAISNSPSGWLVGGTLGYNYQMGSWVLGIEGDVDWSDVKGSAVCGAFTCDTKLNYLGTIRGRIGYAFDRWLPYVTGGGAYGDVKAASSDPATTGLIKSQFGWTVGGGVEYAFSGSWTAKVEYLYVDLGKFDCGALCTVGATTNNISFHENIVRAGLNYKFNGPIFSRY